MIASMNHYCLITMFFINVKAIWICLETITVKAVNDVSLFIKKGETLSVAGEGGCGKSTLARGVMGLYSPNSGEVYYRGIL